MKKTVKKIAVFTGSRAEYGLLYWLMRDIAADPELELQLIVSGMHLSPEFGSTWQAIEADGFKIDARVEMLLSSDTPVGIAKSMGLGSIGFADALERLQPDCLVLLGDRFEALAIAQVAMVMRIPMAHLHGGELTEGLIDDPIRHAITKMAHLHFTSTETYRQRVIQLGEQPSCVFNAGAPAVENLRRLKLLSLKELEADLDFSLPLPPLLVTYHPVTLQKNGGAKELQALLTALEGFVEHYPIVVTYPNADTNRDDLIQLLINFSNRHHKRILLTKSLGFVRYLSLMKHAGVVIGNSSSGLLEAPALGVPTVDIGIRQKGRLKPDSVIECSEDPTTISSAIYLALSDKHQQKSRSLHNPYGDGRVSEKVISILKEQNLEALIFKKFHDQIIS